MLALAESLDVAVVFLELRTPSPPPVGGSPLGEIEIEITTANELASRRYLALIRKAFTQLRRQASVSNTTSVMLEKVLERHGFVGVKLISSRALALDGVTDLSPLICGDGETQAELGEECDDGNDVSGDGCSASCQVEYNWHCFHCQIEDNVCNGTDTDDRCKFEGCQLGISLCRTTDKCALWYGRCYQGQSPNHKCWACMANDPMACLDCTPGYSILQPQEISRSGRDKQWAITRGNLQDQPLPKWYAPYGFRGPCEIDASSRGKKGPHPTATQLHPDAPDFPADETGNSGDNPPFNPYGMPPVCFRWRVPDQIIHNVCAFLILMAFGGLAHFCFEGVDRRIARQKRAISRPDLPRPKIWRPVYIPGEDDASSDELSDAPEEEALLEEYA